MQMRAKLRAGMFRATLMAAPFALALPTSAVAEGQPAPLNAIARPGMAVPRLGAQFQLHLQLADGRLARALLDVGVRQEDAAAAAKLAVGHLGAGAGGCEANVSIERNAGGDYRLMRVQLVTQERRAVIEWRGAGLALTSDAPIGKIPPLV